MIEQSKLVILSLVIYMILHEAELHMGQNYNHGDQMWFHDKNAIFFIQ